MLTRRTVVAVLAALGGFVLWRARERAPEASPPVASRATSIAAEGREPVLVGLAPIGTRMPTADGVQAPRDAEADRSTQAAKALQDLRQELLHGLDQELALLRAGDELGRRAGLRIALLAVVARKDPEHLEVLRSEVLPKVIPELAGLGSRSLLVDTLAIWHKSGLLVVDDLKAAFDRASPDLRAGILDALREIDASTLPPREVLRACAAEGHDDLARAALGAIARSETPPAPADVDLAGPLLESSSAELRAWALEVLARAAVPSARWNDRVVGLWDHEDAETRLSARTALARSDPDRAVVLALAGLDSSDPRTRGDAVWAFGLMPERAPPHAEAILAALRDPDPQVRATAANALLVVPTLSERSIPALVAILPEGGRAAYEALGSLARLDYDTAVPHLEAALRSEDPRLRYMAVSRFAASKRDDPIHRRALLTALADADFQVRRVGLTHLSTLANHPVDLLLPALERGDTQVQRAVIGHLRRRGAAAKAALPVLDRLSGDPAVGAEARVAADEIRGR